VIMNGNKIDKHDFRIKAYTTIYRALKKVLTSKIQTQVKRLKNTRKRIESQSEPINEDFKTKLEQQLRKYEIHLEKLKQVSKADLKLLTLVFLVKELKIDITKHNDYFNNEVEDYQNKLEGWDTAEYNKDSQLVFWLYQSIKTHKVIGRTKKRSQRIAGESGRKKGKKKELKSEVERKN